MMNRLRIVQHDINPRKARFWLNDQELTGVRLMQVSWAPNDITTADITFAVDHLDIDSETLANLRAIVEVQERQQ